jgi:hypothetical protein
MKTHQQILGIDGENIATKYLIDRGYSILNEISEMVMLRLIS